MMMKTFANTRATTSSGFSDNNDTYWKQANVVPRSKALQASYRLTILSFLRPFRTHSAELLNGKTFPTACISFNPENEEFDAGRCPWCEWEYMSSCNYLVEVLVHNWLDNPNSNPCPEKGPTAILELTKDMIKMIATVNEEWGLDPENGGICNPECGVILSLSATRKGDNGQGPIDYTIQGVPNKTPITREWLDQNYASGALKKWDLNRYANSKTMVASQMLPWLARNGYAESIEWLDGLADNLLGRSDYVNNLASSQEEADAFNSQLQDTEEDKAKHKFVYLGEKGIRERTDKALATYKTKNGAPAGGEASGAYQASNFADQSAGSMGFGQAQQGAAPAMAPAPAAGMATPAPSPAAHAAPSPAAHAAPRPTGAPAPLATPAAAPRPTGGVAPAPKPMANPLSAPNPNL